MKKRKIITIALAFILALSIFGGCSAQEEKRVQTVGDSLAMQAFNGENNQIDDASNLATTVVEKEMTRYNSTEKGRYKYTISFVKEDVYGYLVPLGNAPFGDRTVILYFLFEDANKVVASLSLDGYISSSKNYGQELHYFTKASDLKFGQFQFSSNLNSFGFEPTSRDKDIIVFYSDIANLCDLKFSACPFRDSTNGDNTSYYDVSNTPLRIDLKDTSLSFGNENKYDLRLNISVEDTQPVIPVITITTQPTSKTFSKGENQSILVSASVANSTSPITYKWYNGTTFIENATTSTLNLNSLAVGTHQIKCVVSSVGAVDVTSNVSTITINAVVVPTTSPTPTEKPTEPTPTEKPIEPTTSPTPTEKPTEPTPTEKPTEPTTSPTPTDKPTEPTPTEKPIEPTPTPTENIFEKLFKVISNIFQSILDWFKNLFMGVKIK